MFFGDFLAWPLPISVNQKKGLRILLSSTLLFQLGLSRESQVLTSKCLLGPLPDVCRHLPSQHVKTQPSSAFPISWSRSSSCLSVRVKMPSFTSHLSQKPGDRGSSLPPKSPTSNYSLGITQSTYYPSLILLASTSCPFPQPWVWTSFSLTWTTATACHLIFLHSQNSAKPILHAAIRWFLLNAKPITSLMYLKSPHSSPPTGQSISDVNPTELPGLPLCTFNLSQGDYFQFPKPGKPIHITMLPLFDLHSLGPSLKTASCPTWPNSNMYLSPKPFLTLPMPIPRQSLLSFYSHSRCVPPCPCLSHTGSSSTQGIMAATIATTTFLLSLCSS